MKQLLLRFTTAALLASFIGCGAEPPPPAPTTPLPNDVQAPEAKGAKAAIKSSTGKSADYVGPNFGEPPGGK